MRSINTTYFMPMKSAGSYMKQKIWLAAIATLLIILTSLKTPLPILGLTLVSISSPASSPAQEGLGAIAFDQRRHHLLTHLAKTNLEELGQWQQRNQISDPHKYVLPVILARFSLDTREPEAGKLWQMVEKLHQQQPSLYHFRSIFDICLFFRFREIMPASLQQIYQRMVSPPQVLSWLDQGTENHMFMQRASGLALLDGSGWQSPYPAVAATNEAWLRAEISKFFTIGQGEFNSSTYTGYSIAGLLNLYDFAKTPELKTLAKAGLDWLATNMALRYSWGTMGGAESRGYDRGTGDGSGLSAIAWLWWGGVDAPDISNNYARVALIPALSSYRPPAALEKLALKEIPLPFQLRATHPAYYSYHQAQQFGETFYVTPDYSLGTLLIPQRSYQTQGTINAQYATHKLVIRPLPVGRELEEQSVLSIPDRSPLALLKKGGTGKAPFSRGLGVFSPLAPLKKGGTGKVSFEEGVFSQRSGQQQKNTVITLGGTFHSPLATGASPGDQYLQSQGTVIYQLRLNDVDIQAGVPPASHLVLPAQVSQPRRFGSWYIWSIEGVWLIARGWGDGSQLTSKIINTQQGNYQIWEAQGRNTAWITEVATLREYPTWADLTTALSQTAIEDSLWERLGKLSYSNLKGESLTMIYNPNMATAQDISQDIQDWQVISSPYITESLRWGILAIKIPGYPHEEINLREIIQLALS